jgi:hypothetical protein
LGAPAEPRFRLGTRYPARNGGVTIAVLNLSLVDGATVSVVIVDDDHDVEDIAGDIAAQVGIVFPTPCTFDLPPEVSSGAGLNESSKWPPTLATSPTVTPFGSTQHRDDLLLL